MRLTSAMVRFLPVNVGLLGAGRIGAFHAEVLAEHEDLDALLVGDIDAEGAAAVAKEVGGRPIPSRKSLVRGSTLRSPRPQRPPTQS